MKNVMTRAWEIARNSVVKFGGKVVEYLSGALKMAWAEIKKGAIEMKGTEKQVKWALDIRAKYEEKTVEYKAVRGTIEGMGLQRLLMGNERHIKAEEIKKSFKLPREVRDTLTKEEKKARTAERKKAIIKMEDEIMESRLSNDDAVWWIEKYKFLTY